jgi:uncharacterized protein (DUF983 family)
MSLIPAILTKRCPGCRQGKVYAGLFSLNKRCPECDYDFYPEPGFYLGAMMVPYFFSAMLTVPFAIVLKLRGLDEMPGFLIAIAVFYFALVALLLYYARVVWLHLEYRISGLLRSSKSRRGRS